MYGFEVSKLAVLSAGKDLAEGCPTAADPVYGNINDLPQITRLPRPMGEGVVTDHPENVTLASTWKPVEYQAFAPRSGVTLEGGLFQTVLERNIGYLLDSFTVQELPASSSIAPVPNPPDLRVPDPFWEEDLAGSNAGRFLMGAGNTLRWSDHPELRHRLNAVVDAIDDCKAARMATSWLIQRTASFILNASGDTLAYGYDVLIEGGYCGNRKTFAWFTRGRPIVLPLADSELWTACRCCRPRDDRQYSNVLYAVESQRISRLYNAIFKKTIGSRIWRTTRSWHKSAISDYCSLL